MNKAISCKKHPKFFIQWIRILKGGIDFGCIKCKDNIKDHEHILYLPEVIENPDIIIPHLPIDEYYKTFYNNLLKFSEEELEKTYVPLEKSLKYLYELLKNFVENGRANIEEFKKKCKESRQQLYQQFKIQEISQLIQQFELDQNQDAQDQIQKKLIDINEKMNEDLMKEQSSIIKKIINETSLEIYKLNLYCDKQIDEISTQINKNTDLLKQYFNQSFFIVQIIRFSQKEQQQEEQYQNSLGLVKTKKRCNLQLQADFPYYLSKILPQYYFDYILNQIDFQERRNGFNQNKYLRAYFMYEPTSQEIVNGKQFWNVDHVYEQIGRKGHHSFEPIAKLIIFKSNNNGNPIFGYFKSNGTEFIFSFTHNEIYPKKKQVQQNQYQNIGSVFGMAYPTSTPTNSLSYSKQLIPDQRFHVGGDLQIESNLIGGISMLGQDFIWDSQKNGIEQTEYLFGGAMPNIQLCEVFCF